VRRIGAQDGGVLAKTLTLLLIVLLLGAGAMYVYGKRQQPLSVDSATLHATDTGTGTIVLAPDGRVYVATIVHNDGVLPVSLLGLDDTPAPNDQPYAASSIGLGDGKTANPAAAAAFTSVALKPGAGVGIFLVYEPNPRLDCANGTETPSRATSFGPIPLRFSTYGVESTQAIEIPGAPDVAGFTRAQCEDALGG
jgi:hypothetical protein